MSGVGTLNKKTLSSSILANYERSDQYQFVKRT